MRVGGAQAVFNIYKLRVLANQFSKGWIWLNHREKDVISSIQFGWAVSILQNLVVHKNYHMLSYELIAQLIFF